MKKFSFLALAAAGLLLGACSDKDEAVKEVSNPEVFTDGAYLGISLQLPSADQSITRANDDLSNGTEDEFAVKNATLYIFSAPKGTANPDAAATFVDYVILATSAEADKEGGINPDKWGVQTGVSATNITSTISEATLIPNELASQMKTDTDNDYYGYVIINHNGQVTVDATDKSFAKFSKQEFSEIGADIALEANIHGGGLLMTSSPICNYGGGNAAPTKGTGTSDPEVAYTTLVKLDNSKIFGTKEEAVKNPAGCIYVERAAVKITVEDNRTETTITDDNLDVEILGWKVINTEPTYYNTRQINNNGSAAEDWGPFFNESCSNINTTYRFVSILQFNPTKPTTTVAQPHTKGFRTYFGCDPQYATDATLNFTTADDARPWITVAPTNHAYTTENTFDVAHQTWRNTTMVTLKTQIGNGNTNYYTVGKNSQTLLDEAGAKATIQTIVSNDPDVSDAYDALCTAISNANEHATVTQNWTVTISVADPDKGETDVQFTIVPKPMIGTEAVNLTGYNLSDLNAAIDAVVSTIPTGSSEAVTSDAVLLSYYKGGISYYNIRIKHFGEEETPWSATLSAALEAANAGAGYITGGGKDVNEIYGIGLNPDKSKQRFLGRYGVVRDNWYKLSVDKIGKIGTAEPVNPSITTPNTPDDEIENYISVHVHILPWVLRSQSVNF